MQYTDSDIQTTLKLEQLTKEHIKTVQQVSKDKRVTVSAVHKAIKENRLDFFRIDHLYLVYVKNQKYLDFGRWFFLCFKYKLLYYI